MNKNNKLSTELVTELRNNFCEYVKAVVESRAIPDARDGLIPSKRRIIFSMASSNITHRSAHKKSARIVGDVLGKYHPHGDSSLYMTMVKMGQSFLTRYPLIDPHGNFGSVDGDPPAAMRYTEVRLSAIADELVRDINKETVPFVDNYDGSEKEPSYLPSYLPYLLLNGTAGIAVGMATNIPSHNLNELIDGAIYLYNHPNCSINDLMKYITGPDFASGGNIINGAELLSIYETGRGSIKISAKTEIVQNKKREAIIISELPYQVNKSHLLIKISQLIEEKKLINIRSINDYSNQKEIKVVIEIKSGANSRIVLNKLFKLTQLLTSIGVNLTAIVDQKPQVLNLKLILESFINHRIDILLKKTVYDLKIENKKLATYRCYLKAISKLDEVIVILKKANKKEEAVHGLRKLLDFNKKEVDLILNLKLQTLSGFEKTKLENNVAECLEKIKYNERILLDKNLQKSIIVENLTKIKNKYGNKRRTKIFKSAKISQLKQTQMIEDEECLIMWSNNNYFKKIKAASIKSQKKGGYGISLKSKAKNNNYFNKITIVNSTDCVLFFTNIGKVFSRFTHEIKNYTLKANGIPWINLFPLGKNEFIVDICSFNLEKKEYEFVVVTTKKGYIAKYDINAFLRLFQTGNVFHGLREGDEIVNVSLANDKDVIFIVKNNCKAVKHNINRFRTYRSKNKLGSKAIKTTDDFVKSAAIVKHNGANEICVLSSKGHGKRMPLAAISFCKGISSGQYIFRKNNRNDFFGVLPLNKIDVNLIVITTSEYLININNVESFPKPVTKDSIGNIIIRHVDGDAKIISCVLF